MHIQNYFKRVKDKRKRDFILTAMKMGISVEIISEDFRIIKLIRKEQAEFLHNEKANFNLNPEPVLSKNREVAGKGVLATELFVKEFMKRR